MSHYQQRSVQFNSAELKFLASLIKFSASEFISNDDMNLLILKYRQDKDPLVLQEIMSQIIRFIISIAKRYKTPNIDIGDLIQEASEGVIMAVDVYYQTDSPEKFITYIKPIVERRIKDSADRFKQAVELPKNVRSSQGKLKINGGVNIGTNVIFSKRNILSVAAFKPLHKYFDSEVKGTDEDLLITSLKFDINRVLSNVLTKIEQTIIVHSFGLNGEFGKSLESISDILNVTPQRIGDLKVTALNKIKRNKAAVKVLSMYLN